MVPRIPRLMTCLLLSIAAGAVWGQGQPAERSKPASSDSYIEGWHDGNEDEQISSWTWFGMGYEFRNSGASSNAIASGISPQRVNNGKK